MKKKSLNKKLNLQKENIVNLNQLISIKGGYEIGIETVPPSNLGCNEYTRASVVHSI